MSETVDDQYRRGRSDRLDQILRKLHSKGMDGLDQVEKELLVETSKELRQELSAGQDSAE